MNCQDYQELLSAYLDRELSQEDQKDVAHHLESCAVCLGEMKALLAIKEQVRGVHLPSMPADLVAQIESQTLFRAPWWEKARIWGVPALALAAALGVWALLYMRTAAGPRVPPNMPVARLPVEQMPAEHPLVAWHTNSDSDTTKDLQ